MSSQFISPNWHVLLIHYPIAFLSAGILIEILSFLWPRGFFRAAGRWMIVLGALLSIPALAAGIYAFRTTVPGPSPDADMGSWHQIIKQSAWSADQWHFMRYHIWLNCIGVGLVVLAVVTWVACSDLWRRRLYFPVLLFLICGMGCFGAGSWYGGESVYRLGTAVAAGQTPSVAGEATSEDEPSKHSHTTDIKWYLPPIELHIVLAGLVFAVSLGALALTIRRLELPAAKLEPAEVIGPGDAAIATPPQSHEPLELVTPAEAAVISAPMSFSSHPSLIAPIIHAGRFWLLAFLAALVTALAGLSSVVDDFSAKRLTRNWESLQHPKGEYRLLLHVIFGASLILLPLILALLARYGRRRRGVTTVFLALIVLAIACQFWLGIALFYDGRHGFIYRFTP